MEQNYYTILGVESNAHQDDIKKAYRNLARKFHPDINKESDADAQFKKINEAYETLSDEYRRRDYDNSLKPPFESGGGFHPFGDFSFGGAPPRPPKGADLQQFLDLNFEEMLFGARKRLNYAKHTNCPACKGSGSKTGVSQKCGRCNGAGRVIAYRRFGPINLQESIQCDACSGRGALIENPCTTCGGSGLTLQNNSIELEIPPGSMTGMNLTVEGKGHDCAKNLGPPGDLVVSVSIRPHPTLSLEINSLNIVSKVKINVLHALVGTKFTSAAPDYGTNKLTNITITLPAGTGVGQKFRIPFKGLKNIQNPSQIGDLIIEVEYEIPAVTDPVDVEKVQSLIR